MNSIPSVISNGDLGLKDTMMGAAEITNSAVSYGHKVSSGSTENSSHFEIQDDVIFSILLFMTIFPADSAVQRENNAFPHPVRL